VGALWRLRGFLWLFYVDDIGFDEAKAIDVFV